MQNVVDSRASCFIPEANRLEFVSMDEVVIIQCPFMIDRFQPEFFGVLEVEYPEHLNRAVVKRQAEYLAGRYAAKIALEHLSVFNTPISTGQHRNPIWPQGVIGSITHTNIHAICAVARSDQLSALGIDLEKWLDDDLVEKIQSGIVSDQEAQWLNQQTMPFSKAFTLTFSAKESLFKALYPDVGRYFDFSAAQMTNINTQNNTFDIALIEDLTPVHQTGCVYQGIFNQTDKEVMTIISKLA